MALNAVISPNQLKRTVISFWREMKYSPKGSIIFTRQRRVLSEAKDLDAILHAYLLRSFAALRTRSCIGKTFVSRFARNIGISRQELISFLLVLYASTGLALDPSPTSNCKRALNELNETKLLLAINPSELAETLSTWSSDLLARTVLEIRGPYLSYCRNDEKFSKAAAIAEQAYLKKLGIQDIVPTEQAILFRACLTLKDDFDSLQLKVSAQKDGIKKLADLRSVYKTVDEFKGIALVAESVVDFKPFKEFVTKACNGVLGHCLFSDAGTLFKVMVTDTAGVAAYIPELSVLVLSKELIENANLLNSFIVLHELAHVAERAAWNRERFDWKVDWRHFSGWEFKKGKWTVSVGRKKRKMSDLLIELSAGTPYSILPDDLVWGKRGTKKLDGFVLEKSYRESLERNDISEDLADSIAAYHLKSDRFCVDGQDFAPRKRAWIAEHVFKGSSSTCP